MAGPNRSNGFPHLAPIVAPPRRHPAAVLKERIETQYVQIQSLRDENHRLVNTDVALKQELYEADRELKYISEIAMNLKTQKELQVRNVYEASLKMEAEARRINSMSMEISKVRADIEKLSGDRQDLTERLRAIEGDIEKMKPQSHRVQVIVAECECMRYQIKKARAAIEFEKKNRGSNLKHREAMEASIASMTPKLLRLRGELVNAEKRARAAAAAAAASSPIVGYSSSYGNPVTGYGGISYVEPYGFHLVNGRADSVPQYPAAGATQNALMGVHGMNTHP